MSSDEDSPLWVPERAESESNYQIGDAIWIANGKQLGNALPRKRISPRVCVEIGEELKRLEVVLLIYSRSFPSMFAAF